MHAGSTSDYGWLGRPRRPHRVGGARDDGRRRWHRLVSHRLWPGRRRRRWRLSLHRTRLVLLRLALAPLLEQRHDHEEDEGEDCPEPIEIHDQRFGFLSSSLLSPAIDRKSTRL